MRKPISVPLKHPRAGGVPRAPVAPSACPKVPKDAEFCWLRRGEDRVSPRGFVRKPFEFPCTKVGTRSHVDLSPDASGARKWVPRGSAGLPKATARCPTLVAVTRFKDEADRPVGSRLIRVSAKKIDLRGHLLTPRCGRSPTGVHLASERRLPVAFPGPPSGPRSARAHPEMRNFVGFDVAPQRDASAQGPRRHLATSNRTPDPKSFFRPRTRAVGAVFDRYPTRPRLHKGYRKMRNLVGFAAVCS